MILCRLFGHKWKFMGHSGMNDQDPGYEIYECLKCDKYCRISEKDGKEEIYA